MLIHTNNNDYSTQEMSYVSRRSGGRVRIRCIADTFCVLLYNVANIDGQQFSLLLKKILFI
jgi:hypothetical protein